jgi:WD40 repeat protein
MAETEEIKGGSKTASLMISYSRKDKEFVKQLYESLLAQGFSSDDIWVDWEGIPLSADWMAEITKGIQSANAFIFVISPDSAASDVCKKEIEIAADSNKRFIPIMYREPGKDVQIHPKISSHNWVFIRDEAELEKTLPSLVEAINTDLDWLAQHTRLFNRAKEWEHKGRNDSYLVRGNDLQDAETFITEGAGGKEPPPTALHVTYVQAARKFAAAVRRRNRIIAAVVGVALLVLSVIALIQWGNALTQKGIADDNAATAVANQYIANTAEAVAVTAQSDAERKARESNALALAAEAVNQKNSDTQLSLMLALLSIQETQPDKVILPESKSALFSSLNSPNVLHTWDNNGVVVWAAAYDPTGKYIAIGDVNGVVQLFDAGTSQFVRKIDLGAGDNINGLAFSPDGGRLGIASGVTASVWDVESGTELLTLAGHGGEVVNDIAFSPDGKLIATGGDDSNVKTWLAETGSLRVTLPGHESFVNSVAFSPDSTRIISGSEDDTAILWDVETNSLLNRFRPDGLQTSGNYVRSVAFNPTGDRVIVGGYQTVVVWNAFPDYKEIYRLRGNQTDVYAVGFAPDGLSMVTASSGVKIWDSGNGTERFNLSAHRGEVTSVAYSPDGDYLVTGSWDNTAKLWSANLRIETLNMRQHDARNLDAIYSPDGKLIVTNDEWGDILVHDAQTGQVLTDWAAKVVGYSPSFDPQDSQKILTVDADKKAFVWDGGQTAPILTITDEGPGIGMAIFSPDGKKILTTDFEGKAKIWDAGTGAQLLVLDGHDGNLIKSAQFSDDGKYIVTASIDKTAKIWDASNGTILQTLAGHTDYVLSAVFSHDNAFVYTGSFDNTIRKWDVKTGRLVQVMTGHTGRVLDLAISPDDKLLASASADTTVKIWDVSTGKEMYTYRGNNEDVTSVAFSPDGKQVLTASFDGTSKEFTINFDTLLQIAQEYELRPLTTEECQRYLKRDDCTLTLFGQTSVNNAAPTPSPAVQTTPTPADQPAPLEPTLTPTPAPAVAAPSTGQSFYTQNFDGNLDSWTSFMGTGIESQVSTSTQNGSLDVQLSPYEDKIARYYLVNNAFTYSNVKVEVVTTNYGSNSNGVVLVCQYSDSGWYEFSVSNAGLYSINAYDPNVAAQQGYTQLASGGSAAIKPGKTTNTYTAVCNGSELTLLVNDTLVKTVTDTKFNFAEGEIGIGVSSPDLLPVDVSIESVTVSAP